MEQKIWHRKELSILEELLTFKDGLVNDFMKGHVTLKDAVFAQSENTINPGYYDGDQMNMAEGMLVSRNSSTKKWSTDFTAWQSVGLKNVIKIDGKIQTNEIAPQETLDKYPTAKSLMEKYGDDLYGLVYSAIGPYTILQRHVGPENIDGVYLRVHIPLIVPPGDIFLECDNEEATWDDIWGFNNQHLHSAHNYSNEWRLIMIADISRERCGLPPGRKFKDTSEREKPFIRGWQF